MIEQMQRTGRELTKEELKDFPLFTGLQRVAITQIENTIEFTMNIQGLMTPMELDNSVRIYDTIGNWK